MKIVWISSLLIFVFSTCRRDKTIESPAYNGEYPYVRSTGKSITTFQPILGTSWQMILPNPEVTPVPAVGQYTFQFKDHDWNHWPYLNLSFRLVSNPSPPLDRLGSRILGVGITAMSSYLCAMESVGFVVPAKVGRYRFGQEVDYDATNPSFHTLECDVAKDRMEADGTAGNWVNIVRLDTLSNQVEGTFDLNFTMVTKDESYSLVYPTHIRMRGNFNGPFTRL